MDVLELIRLLSYVRLELKSSFDIWKKGDSRIRKGSPGTFPILDEVMKILLRVKMAFWGVFLNFHRCLFLFQDHDLVFQVIKLRVIGQRFHCSASVSTVVKYRIDTYCLVEEEHHFLLVGLVVGPLWTCLVAEFHIYHLYRCSISAVKIFETRIKVLK